MSKFESTDKFAWNIDDIKVIKRGSLNVGECQAIYDKYLLDISLHTKESTKLCQVIKELEEKNEALKVLLAGLTPPITII